MLLKDLIAQTRSILPLFDNRFTTNLEIISITKTGTTVTVNATDHNLLSGTQIIISGVKSNIVISNMTTSNNIVTVTTTTDHDLTFRYTLYAEIVSPEADYTGTFEILSVPDKNTFTFRISSNPADNTGTLKTFHNIGFNGVQTVSAVVDVNNFQYELNLENSDSGSGDNMLVMKSPRISGAANLERANQTYTDFDDNQLWGFFVFEGMTTSDDNTIDNDSKNEREPFSDYKLRLIKYLVEKL